MPLPTIHCNTISKRSLLLVLMILTPLCSTADGSHVAVRGWSGSGLRVFLRFLQNHTVRASSLGGGVLRSDVRSYSSWCLHGSSAATTLNVHLALPG